MITNYKDYILEKRIYNMIKESKIVYSNRFINILNKMRDNKIASYLIDIYKKDVDGLKYNYIDTTDDKSRVSFTPDKKAQEIIGDKPEVYEVTDSNRYLTHSDRNDKTFELLGYDKESMDEAWAPNVGTLGTIIKETISPISGRVYCLFKEYTEEYPKMCVINKNALMLSDTEDSKVWKSSRNPISVGRLVRAILKSANVEFKPKDIENFVNIYKATFDFVSDALKQFDTVQGTDIAYWYRHENYEDGAGALNKSCMDGVNEGFFDIYCYNKQVQMLILYGDKGQIIRDKYTSDKIKGRAILWECEIDGQKAIFMDRIYTTNDSDVELFKQYAVKNGWWYKYSQSMDPDAYVTDGNTRKPADIVAKLDDVEWDEYPYMDTLCFISKENYTASNIEDGATDITARDTDGEYMIP